MQSQVQYIAGFSLLVVGCVLPFIYRGPSYPDYSLSEFVVPIPFLAVGIGLIEWRVLLLLVALGMFCINREQTCLPGRAGEATM